MLMVYPWAFTRIWMLGVWRYLRNVDEAKSPRFLFVYPSANGLNWIKLISKNYLYEENKFIIYDSCNNYNNAIMWK